MIGLCQLVACLRAWLCSRTMGSEPQTRVSTAHYILDVRFDVILVVGCEDVAPPGGAEASREGDVMTIRCNFTGETWFLSCSETQWTGTLGNCSSQQPPTASKINDSLAKGVVSCAIK